MDLVKEKIGVFIGIFVINLFFGDKLFIWIVDYVLLIYGIGVVMVVFGYDEWDYEFVMKFNLLIIEVIEGGEV